MKILGVDPGKATCAWAAWITPFVSVSAIHVSVSEFCLQAVGIIDSDPREIAGLLEREQPDIVAVETQYLGVNAQAMIGLVEARMMWETCAKIQQMGVRRVNPRSWQTGLFSVPRPSTRMMELETRAKANREYKKAIKATAMAEAQKYVARKLTQDEADAICIGLYQAMQEESP